MHLFMFQPSPAPGQGSPASAPASGPPATATEGQASGPPPEGGGGLFGGGGLSLILPLVAFMLFMFWSQRSQAKKQKAIEEGIKVGERVVTTAGLIGKVTEVGDRVTLEIAPGVRAQFLKSAIQGPDPGSAPKKDEPKKDEPKKDEPAPKSKDGGAKDK